MCYVHGLVDLIGRWWSGQVISSGNSKTCSEVFCVGVGLVREDSSSLLPRLASQSSRRWVEGGIWWSHYSVGRLSLNPSVFDMAALSCLYLMSTYPESLCWTLQRVTLGFCYRWARAVTWIHRVEGIKGHNYSSNILPTRVSVHLHFKRYGSSTPGLFLSFCGAFGLLLGFLGLMSQFIIQTRTLERVKEDTINNYTSAADVKHTNMGKSGFIHLLLASKLFFFFF